MDPRLNDDEKAWRDRAREAAAPLRAAAAAIDADDETPRELLAALGGAGMLGACVAAQHGGGGGGALHAALMCEELGAAGAGTTAAVVAHIMACRLIETCGGDAQAELLSELAEGTEIAAVVLDGGVSLLEEPAVSIVASHTEEGAVLNGEARNVTGAVSADLLVVPAMDGSELIVALLERSAGGVTMEQTGRKLGLNGSGCGDVTLTGAVAMALGGDGVAALDEARDLARVADAALCVGIGRAAQEASARHAKSSEEGLDRSQSVQWMIADQATETEAARLLTWYAATRAGTAELREAGAMARLLAVDAAVGATRRAVQIFGAQGNRASAGVERLYRDAKAMEVHDGAAEAQRTAVARGLLADLFEDASA
ncbi:MAG: acyl-CoA dehydrogenase family protein, partial [Acidobacteriota bacterium]